MASLVSKQHAGFIRRLKASSDAVFCVARWLHNRGQSVEIPALRFAPTAADADDYVDNGDLIAVNPETGATRRIEVKHTRRNFTGPDDWPFPEPDVFVSNVGTVDRAAGKVAAYITVAANMKAMTVTSAETRDSWYVREKRAKNTGNVERYYVCPLSRVRFYLLNEQE